jgi:hypothetical protein
MSDIPECVCCKSQENLGMWSPSESWHEWVCEECKDDGSQIKWLAQLLQAHFEDPANGYEQLPNGCWREKH